MKTWSLAEAKKHFTDVLDAAEASGPQRIGRDAKPFVLVSEADWNRLLNEFRDPADLTLKAPFDSDDLPARQPARVASDPQG